MCPISAWIEARKQLSKIPCKLLTTPVDFFTPLEFLRFRITTQTST
jgi:hypothetical protein